MDTKNDILPVLDKVQSWRDKSDKNSVFCLFGEKNCDNGYLYSSTVGGDKVIIAHMIYSEMKKNKDLAEAVKRAVEVYDSEE